jgi:hypothetical protein
VKSGEGSRPRPGTPAAKVHNIEHREHASHVGFAQVSSW